MARSLSQRYNVGLHCHDCVCTQKSFEGVYCKRVIVDAWHVKKHKCDKALFDPQHKNNKRRCKGCNTQAAEQLWKVTNGLVPSAMKYPRKYFRLFFKHYCIWRNSFVRKKHKRDVGPIWGQGKQTKKRRT